jgi:hypothetical protein
MDCAFGHCGLGCAAAVECRVRASGQHKSTESIHPCSPGLDYLRLALIYSGQIYGQHVTYLSHALQVRVAGVPRHQGRQRHPCVEEQAKQGLVQPAALYGVK